MKTVCPNLVKLKERWVCLDSLSKEITDTVIHDVMSFQFKSTKIALYTGVAPVSPQTEQ